MMLSRWSSRHSRTVIEPLPTITSTLHRTSCNPGNALAGTSELDDEVGEEDIGYLGGVNDPGRLFEQVLLERRLAVRRDDLFGSLLCQHVDKGRAEARQRHVALLHALGLLLRCEEAEADAEKPLASGIGQVHDERLEGDDA